MLLPKAVYIYWLSQIQHSEKSLVGDKLFVLSQLLQNECSILPGFVIASSLFRQFLTNIEDDFPQDRLNIDNYRALQSIASRSRQTIARTLFPKTWQGEIFRAARQLNSDSIILQPFITTPYGQHRRIDRLWRSHTCNTNPTALAEAIKLAWSQLFTASSMLYWHKLGLSSDRVNLAVLVKPLKTAYASGIVEISDDSIRIKASWGLEYSLLRGDVEPDEYYLDRYTGHIQGQHLGHKNYAYRPKTTDRGTSSQDCLEAYVPGENLAETYVLNPQAIALLLRLTQDILTKQPQITYLVWTALQTPEEFSNSPHFYFTQLHDNLTTIEAVDKITTLSTAIQPLLSGISASPGSIRAKVVVVKDLNTYSQHIPAGSILVTKTIPPLHISLIKQVAGIITETGGRTSHGAIVARELNIPAVVNAVDATNLLHNDDKVLLDGSAGKVYSATARQISRPSGDRLFFTYPIATKLMVNLSQPESIASAVNLPVDGVGLLRSELMLADLLASQTLARWQESFQRKFVTTLSDSLGQFTSAFAPRPVFYRSLDRYAEDTINPVLGNRGTYSYLLDSTLFDLELEALATITAQGDRHLNLILPFVRSVEEFKFCYRRLENVGLTAQSSFQVWIMAEVPSVILLLPEYVRAGVRGIVIGTNDLTQLLLGVDREQTQFSDRGLNANHPAMHQAIFQLIKTAKANNIECSLCGQAPVQHPSLIDKLIEWGITAISVEPEAVARTYRAIARAERRMLLGEVISNKPST